MSTVSRCYRLHTFWQAADQLPVDDCWSLKDGRVDGHIAPNTTRFPDGIDGLAQKVHALGLKLGIYSSKPASLDLLLIIRELW